MALNLKTLGTRSLSAFFFVIILVSCIWYSYISFVLLFFCVSLVALQEYYRLAEKLDARPFKVLGFLFGVVLFLACCSDDLQRYFGLPPVGLNHWLSLALLLFPFVALIRALVTHAPGVLVSALHTIVGVVYAVFPFGLLVTIPVFNRVEAQHYDYFVVLGIIFLIWSNDTLAYLGGSLLGKNKMYERISPGKTWEGTITGVIGAIGVGFLLNLNHTYASPLVWPVIALLVGVFGTLGDLVESMLKRLAGVKDSGSLMPGHGGALDRFDSLIFVTPFVYVFLKLI
jgi:phosphatidate cytidylyltransferase